MKRRVRLNLLTFSLAFVWALLWLASSVVSFKQVDRPYKISADFDNAFGVLPNAEVSYIGVPFGKVTKVERITDGVRVNMAIKRGRQIPRGSTANIQRKSAIGEQFVDFYPPKTGGLGAIYKDGDHITRDLTTVPLEFSELLRSFSAVLAAVPPDAIGTIIHETATGLRGNEDALRALAVAGDKLTATIASRTEALDRISANGGKLTRVLAEHRGSIGEIVDNLAELNRTFAASKDSTAALLDRGSPLLAQLAELVGKHKAELDCDLKVLEVVIDTATTPQQVAGLRALLTWAPVAFAGVWDSRDLEAEGVWVRVGMITSPVDNPPVQFNPPRKLPPVIPAPACKSNIAPSSGDYKP